MQELRLLGWFFQGDSLVTAGFLQVPLTCERAARVSVTPLSPDRSGAGMIGRHSFGLHSFGRRSGAVRAAGPVCSDVVVRTLSFGPGSFGQQLVWTPDRLDGSGSGCCRPLRGDLGVSTSNIALTDISVSNIPTLSNQHRWSNGQFERPTRSLAALSPPPRHFRERRLCQLEHYRNMMCGHLSDLK